MSMLWSWPRITPALLAEVSESVNETRRAVVHHRQLEIATKGLTAANGNTGAMQALAAGYAHMMEEMWYISTPIFGGVCWIAEFPDLTRLYQHI